MRRKKSDALSVENKKIGYSELLKTLKWYFLQM